MLLHTDSHYLIGSSHSVCEDYALHGSFDFAPGTSDKKSVSFGIVSDGCSQSSDSDVGARIVAWFMQRHFKRLLTCDRCWYEDIFIDQKEGSFNGNLDVCIFDLLLGRKYAIFPESGEFLDATAWLAAVCNGQVFVFGTGDGALIVKRKSGTAIHCVTYESSAPFYLSYRMNETRKENYLKTFGGVYILSTISIKADGTKSVTHKEYPYNQPFMLKFADSEGDPIQTVSVCSDGFKTYLGVSDDAILGSLEWAVTRMIDYPTVEGVFVERSMRFLEKQDHKKQIFHLDDISMASIAFVPEDQNGQPK